MGTVRTNSLKMKLLLVLAVFGLMAMANGHQKLVKSEQCQGTECPAGCCPEVDWYCCPDNMYCAATAADCPFVAMKEKLVKMAAKKQCQGTECPAGCCPEVATGTAALTTCTVLPLLLTVLLLP
eukprot:TRINITY_DN8_c0_g1_i5.p2 TRINITY_DN8_c0_g1~~TRINITY_DN8_c0_g1_i5.p2  ORF type:complete len:124 (+),score=37.26 TRINITY_DN8_c0_g1_i5:94-465(+)